MKNIKLIIEYDGTNYYGWQKQPDGNTVQQKIEKAISEVTGETIDLIGCSRTDSGVHATGYVANFYTNMSSVNAVTARIFLLSEDNYLAVHDYDMPKLIQYYENLGFNCDDINNKEENEN